MDALIFTLNDVQAIRKVSINIEDFDIFAREAQITFLEKVLGAKLYNLVVSELTGTPSARIQTLFDGEVYDNGGDINYRGLKPYLVYTWLYLYSLESAVAVTPIGSRIFKDEEAAYQEDKVSVRAAQANYMKGAEVNEAMILNYLRAKQSTYPEFSESDQIEVAKQSNNTFRSFGKSYTSPNNTL